MGCFLACFGFSSKKKKRRKLPKVVLVGDKCHGSYEPLDSYVRLGLDDVTEKESSIDASTAPPPSNKQSIVKIKKKVRFDLNVRAYDPIPPSETSPRSSESNDEEDNKKKDAGGETAPGPVGGAQGRHLSYRYQNYIDSYDEDDELVYQDSDFEDEIDSDDEVDSLDGLDFEDDIGFDDTKMSNKEGAQHSGYLPLKSEEEAPCENARYRSKYIHSVLTPVENLVQWKTIKAKEAQRSRHKLKENMGSDWENCLPLPSDLNSKCSRAVSKDDMVNSSLSSWLSLPAADSSPSNTNYALLRTKTI